MTLSPITTFRKWRERRAREAACRKRDQDASYLAGWTIRPAITSHRAQVAFYTVAAPEQVAIMVRLEEILAELDANNPLARHFGWHIESEARRAAVRIAAGKLKITPPQEANK